MLLICYSFCQATNDDELTMKENDDIEIIAEGDGDGWVRVRSRNRLNAQHWKWGIDQSLNYIIAMFCVIFVLFFLSQ